MHMFETFVQHLIEARVPEYTIILLLYLPLVSLVVTFSRYIIGWKSLSIYSSILLTFALYHMSRDVSGEVFLIIGLVQGGILIFFSSLVALLLQIFLAEIRLHYLAKISIAMSFVTIVTFMLLYFASEVVNDTFIKLNPISVLIVIVVMEIFIRSYIRKGWRKSLILIANTIGLSYVMFIILAQNSFKEFVLKHPEVIIYSIVLNIIIGSWRGLRISEFLRFKDIHSTTFYDSEYPKE